MATDPAESLIHQAHAIFSKNSVHEVIDLDREMAVERLIYFYAPDIVWRRWTGISLLLTS
jgi:hypothetical protein